MSAVEDDLRGVSGVNVVTGEMVDPVVLPEPGGLPAPVLPYGDLASRVETIQALILDGSLDPLDGLLLAALPPERVLAVERALREDAGRTMRRRYSEEARERAVALVAGGASCRMAAAAVLGNERLGATVWRWARKKGLL